MAGLGLVPSIEVERDGKVRTIRGKWWGAANASGKRIMLLKSRGLSAHPHWRYLGRVLRTDYKLTPAQRRFGSYKNEADLWVHKHTDEGGRPPKAYMDQAGNVKYAAGTYRVGKWLHR